MGGPHTAYGDKRRFLRLNCDYNRDLRRGDVGLFLTIRLLANIPALSRIEPGQHMPILSPLGLLVEEMLKGLPLRHPDVVRLDSYVIMPDHLHVCLYQLKQSPRTPLQYVTSMLTLIQHEAKKRFGHPLIWNRPGELFVCYSLAKYREKNLYTRGNIARWHMDHDSPHLSHPHALAHPSLNPALSWQGYGHEPLLEHPLRLPAYVSSRASETDFRTFMRLAVKLASEGWLLVGGFVSPRERALLAAVKSAVARPKIIHLAPVKLDDRKLSGPLSALFYGRCYLRLTSTTAETCSRAVCQVHNCWAEQFCGDWRKPVAEYFAAIGSSPVQLENLARFLARWPRPRI